LEGLLLFIHIVVCVLLVIIVLLQSGKSADLAGAFGGAGTQSAFGPRGAATLLSKMTTTLAILFMVTSLSLWIIADVKSEDSKGTVVNPDDVKQEQTRTETTPPATTEDKTGKDQAGQKEGTAPKQPPAGTPADTGKGQEKKSSTTDKTKETPKKEEPGKTGGKKQPGDS
jgi:preprotein translocase subunit SecG